MADQLPDIQGANGRRQEATPVVAVDAFGRIGQLGVEGKLEQAIERGQAFSVGTPLESVPGSQYLKYWLQNPAGSGKRLYVVKRGFSNNRRITQSHLTRGLVINPTPDGAGTNVALNPLDGVSVGNAAGVFGWAVGGAFAEGAAIERNFQAGNTIEISVPRIVLPGQSFGYQIKGQGNGAGSVKVSATLVFIVEDYDDA
ncbi:MAG: hypothetical protein AAFM92_03190 [Pseudomonadota bacterium]